MGDKLGKDFYLQQTKQAAIGLLGKILVYNSSLGRVSGKIVETEAYLGSRDEASHSYSGRTLRNKAMFEEGGILYIYKSYGIHHCLNIVTEDEGVGSAVLIRAIEPIEGIQIMQNNRELTDIMKLCKGPGNLCKAFGLTLDNNFETIINDEIYILNNKEIPQIAVKSTKRVGISRSKELLLRFYIKKSKFISRK